MGYNKSESEEGGQFVEACTFGNGNEQRNIFSGHLVRNNTVAYCGQAGIAGSLGAIFSKIKNNTVHDISTQNLFWGYEMAGIKIHAAVDVGDLRQSYLSCRGWYLASIGWHKVQE